MVVMDDYPIYLCFTLGVSLYIPLGTAFLRECLNEGHLLDANLIMCLLSFALGSYLLYWGYIKDRDRKKESPC